MGTLANPLVLNIKTALAVGDVVVSGCEEVVTSWQTGLSQPMQPWGQNTSQGQSEKFIKKRNNHNKKIKFREFGNFLTDKN